MRKLILLWAPIFYEHWLFCGSWLACDADTSVHLNNHSLKCGRPRHIFDVALSRIKLVHRKVEERVRGKGRNQHWCVSTRVGEWPARYRREVFEGMAFAMTSYKRVNPLATVYPARVVQSCEELS